MPRQTDAYRPPAQAETAGSSLPELPAAGQAQAQLAQAQLPQPSSNQPASPYDFMMSPEQPVRRFSMPGSDASWPMRALLLAGGLFGLLIVFIILKSLFGGGSGLTPFVTVAQDQQELVHLATNVSQQQQGVSTGSQNFAATTQLSVASAQTVLIEYLAKNGHKVSPKLLNLKVSLSIDNQLQAAAAATTYDQTFQQIMKNQLATYMNDLQRAYKQTTGKHGRALLSADYDQAQLLLTQLNEPDQ